MNVNGPKILPLTDLLAVNLHKVSISVGVIRFSLSDQKQGAGVPGL